MPQSEAMLFDLPAVDRAEEQHKALYGERHFDELVDHTIEMSQVLNERLSKYSEALNDDLESWAQQQSREKDVKNAMVDMLLAMELVGRMLKLDQGGDLRAVMIGTANAMAGKCELELHYQIMRERREARS
jgi:hypothetical protein